MPGVSAKPHKILIIKPSSLGDVVQAIPVLRQIKLHHSDSRIYWWIDSRLEGLLENDPDLEGTICFDRTCLKTPGGLKRLWSDIRWIRSQRFDWVIDLQSLARSGIIAWLANGRLTIGLDDHREGARALFDIAVPRAGFNQHAVDWYLATLARLNVPRRPFTWLPSRPEAAKSMRSKWPIDQFKWVSLQPGARWTNKRWPAEHYAGLVRYLASSSSNLRFAVLGAAADKQLAKVISAAAPSRCLDLTGSLSLEEMIEWIRASKLMVSNDTGPMHVAAALGTPLLAIFGPTEPSRTGPYGHLSSVVRTSLDCVPCMTDTCSRKTQPLECLASISPQKVGRIAEGLFQQVA